jgi:hypothetical protein
MTRHSPKSSRQDDSRRPQSHDADTSDGTIDPSLLHQHHKPIDFLRIQHHDARFSPEYPPASQSAPLYDDLLRYPQQFTPHPSQPEFSTESAGYLPPSRCITPSAFLPPEDDTTQLGRSLDAPHNYPPLAPPESLQASHTLERNSQAPMDLRTATSLYWQTRRKRGREGIEELKRENPTAYALRNYRNRETKEQRAQTSEGRRAIQKSNKIGPERRKNRIDFVNSEINRLNGILPPETQLPRLNALTRESENLAALNRIRQLEGNSILDVEQLRDLAARFGEKTKHQAGSDNLDSNVPDAKGYTDSLD